MQGAHARRVAEHSWPPGCRALGRLRFLARPGILAGIRKGHDREALGEDRVPREGGAVDVKASTEQVVDVDPHTTKVMRANKRRNTKPELAVRAMLRELGYPGYRLDWAKAPGRPDIAFPGRKIAIFVNGCFWHHCPTCNLSMPKRNAEYWAAKIERNMARDARVQAELAELGWTVIVIWEHELKRASLDGTRQRLAREMARATSR